jgi:hypothetical protein
MSSMDERQHRISPWQQAGVGTIGSEQDGPGEQGRQGMPPLPPYQDIPGGQFSSPPPLPQVGRTSRMPDAFQLLQWDTTPPPNTTRRLTDYTQAPVVTRQLTDNPEMPPMTAPLPETLQGTFTAPVRTTSSLRQPTIIRGTGKKSRGTLRPPEGRRLVIHIAGTTVLLLVVLGTLLAVIPTGTDGKGLWNPFQSTMDIVKGRTNSPGLIAQQAATATAVTQDGYDPGGGTSFAGLPTAPPGGGGLNRFFYGQCTYWANMRYHELTGYWVPWLGNAWQWVAGAEGYGWVVSSTPQLHSIIVLQPGVEGAGWYGHVAIVEQINADGSVLTSNFNWGGAWAQETFVTFRPGPGVNFVWHP